MPYLENGVRESLADGRLPMTGGELNYLISTMIDQFITRKGLSYTTVNEAFGALACVQQEVYRRVVAPYEDIKSKTNGDVFLNGR